MRNAVYAVVFAVFAGSCVIGAGLYLYTLFLAATRALQ